MSRNTSKYSHLSVLLHSSTEYEDWEEQEEEEGEDLGVSGRRKAARGFIGEWTSSSGDRFCGSLFPASPGGL